MATKQVSNSCCRCEISARSFLAVASPPHGFKPLMFYRRPWSHHTEVYLISSADLEWTPPRHSSTSIGLGKVKYCKHSYNMLQRVLSIERQWPLLCELHCNQDSCHRGQPSMPGLPRKPQHSSAWSLPLSLWTLSTFIFILPMALWWAYHDKNMERYLCVFPYFLYVTTYIVRIDPCRFWGIVLESSI